MDKPILALAPLADHTDSPFCSICRHVSGKNFVIFREMVSAEAIVRGNEKTLKMCEFKKSERPIVIQIFGSNAEVISKAAKIIVDKFKPDGIDINMGCPVPKVAGKAESGAFLMKDHDKACEIVKAVKKVLPKNISLSVKTRLGWEREDEILEFAPKLEKAGADLITIHGRTKMEGYTGKANWEMIGRVKKLVTIPIIANGDVKNREDLVKCLEVTGCDGVMIGRGALGNPWIFKQCHPEFISGSLEIPKQACLPVGKVRNDIILKHAKLHEKHYGSLTSFRKHLAWYFKGNRVEGVKDLKKLKSELMQVKSVDELNKILEEKF